MNDEKVLNNLKKYMNMKEIESVITQCLINEDVKLTLLDCLKNENKKEISILKIESVIDYLYEELNTGHWKNIRVELRQCYSCANFIKILITLSINDLNDDLIKDCLKSLDMALLLGAPIGNNKFVTLSAKYLSNLLLSSNENNELKKLLRKTKRNETDLSDENIFDGIEIETEICPSLERFRELYFQLQLPVKLKECMVHWPAMKKWQDVSYFIRLAGNRTVPVEIGQRYTDQDWSQKLMLLKDFIINYYLSEDGNNIGYLAQHNLFEQIIELKEDIRIPEYCCISLNYEKEKEPDINAWFGPKGTVSPLHYDPQNNILAQVHGTKQLILFSPKDTPYLYPYEDKMLFNTSQVDVLKPDLMKYPNFSKAKAFKCIIRPGDMLFIPKKWWHHVVALDKSFSVSFWWE